MGRINKEFEYLWQQSSGGGNPGAIATAFSKIWGWIYNGKQVAEFENISLEEVWELPVNQFLNDLSYLKMLREVEDEERRRIEFNRPRR